MEDGGQAGGNDSFANADRRNVGEPMGVAALISWLATQPEARLDAPRVAG